MKVTRAQTNKIAALARDGDFEGIARYVVGQQMTKGNILALTCSLVWVAAEAHNAAHPLPEGASMWALGGTEGVTGARLTIARAWACALNGDWDTTADLVWALRDAPPEDLGVAFANAAHLFRWATRP